MRLIKIDWALFIPVVVFFLVLGGYLIYEGYRSWKDDFDEESKDLWQDYYDELEGKEKK